MVQDIKSAFSNMFLAKYPWQTIPLCLWLGIVIYFVIGSFTMALLLIAVFTLYDFVMRLFEVKNGLVRQSRWSGREAASTFKARLLEASLNTLFISTTAYISYFSHEGGNILLVAAIILPLAIILEEWRCQR